VEAHIFTSTSNLGEVIDIEGDDYTLSCSESSTLLFWELDCDDFVF